MSPVSKLKRFRVTFRGADGNPVYVHLLAEDKDHAQHLAEQSQYRRLARFPLTFARLDQAEATGESGMLAISAEMAAQPVEVWVAAEREKRKRDQDRYDRGGMKLVKVEEAVG